MDDHIVMEAHGLIPKIDDMLLIPDDPEKTVALAQAIVAAYDKYMEK